MSETLYIKADKNINLNKTSITVGDIATVWCSDKSIIAKVRAIKLLNVPDVKKRRYVISMIKVIELICSECKNVDVNNIGESDFIIEYAKDNKRNRPLEYLKVAIICLITFIGGAFAIMAYNNDIQITQLFSKLYKLVMGEEHDGFSILEVCYSIGLTLGITIFYNHIGPKKISNDPTPLEVEMRLYEDDINTSIINNSGREDKEIDVN